VSIGACLLRHDENHRARVASRIAGIADLADLPLAADLERDLVYRLLTDVGQSHNGDLAARFSPNVSGDVLDALDGRGIDDVREVVDQARWSGDLDGLLN
jgi:hypothetical protein